MFQKTMNGGNIEIFSTCHSALCVSPHLLHVAENHPLLSGRFPPPERVKRYYYYITSHTNVQQTAAMTAKVKENKKIMS